MNILILLLIFYFGAIVGSFLNVVILRLPADKNLNGRSKCTSCGHTLGSVELVPLVSFLALGRKCRHCLRAVSWRYFIIEAVTGCLFAAAFLFFSPFNLLSGILLVKAFVVLACCVAIFTIDLEHYLILDSVLIAGAVAVTIANIVADILNSSFGSWLNGYTLNSLLAAFIIVLPFFAIWYFSKGRWMGFGDVKLALFLGISLGWPGSLVAVASGIFLGGIVSVGLLAFSAKTLKSQVPFGTFLAFGGVLSLFFGQHILNWYLSTLGF